MKKLFKKLALMVVALLTFSVGSNYTVKEVKAADGVWTLVSDSSTLAEGDQIVIAASDYNYAMSTTQNSNNRGQAAVTKTGDTISFGDDVQIFTLVKGSVDGTFGFSTGDGFIYAASSSSNYLRTESKLSSNSSWKIEVATGGAASIVASGTNTRKVMQYNNSSKIFACYASATQKPISLYKIVEINEDESKILEIAKQETTFSLCFDYSVSFKENVSGVVDSTITFDANKSLRTEYSTEKQVWTNGSVTFINEKASSSSTVADYSNPVRLYAESTITISAKGKISKIVFTANNTTYANDLASSIGSSAKVSGKVVTYTLSEPVVSTTINLSKQVRLNSFVASYVADKQVDTQSYANALILFGASVDASLFEGYTVSGGVLLGNAETYKDTTIADVYNEGKFGTEEYPGFATSKSLNSENGNYTVGSIVEVVKGDITNENIDYLKCEFVAAVYFTLTNENGSKTVVLKQKQYSVKSMVNHYIANPSLFGENTDILDVLNAFSSYIG